MQLNTSHISAYCSLATTKGCRNYYSSNGGSHVRKTFTQAAADHIDVNSGLFKLTQDIILSSSG